MNGSSTVPGRISINVVNLTVSHCFLSLLLRGKEESTIREGADVTKPTIRLPAERDVITIVVQVSLL